MVELRYLGPDAQARPNYQPWLQGETVRAQAQAAAFESLARSIDKLAERRDAKQARQDDRAFQFDRDVAQRQFYSSEADKNRAFQFGQDVSRVKEGRAEATTAFERQKQLDTHRTDENIREAEAKADYERKQREEQQRQFNEATRLARMAYFDTGYTPVGKVKGATLRGYSDELRSQGDGLAGYLGTQRDPTKAEGLLNMVNEAKDAEYYDQARGARLAETITQRAGIKPEIARAAVEQLYGSMPKTFEEVMDKRLAEFNKARGIEAPVRQQTETGSLTPSVKPGSIDPSQAAALESFNPQGQAMPLSSDVLKQVGLDVKDVVPGVGQMAAGFENELKKFSLALRQDSNGAYVVELQGPVDTQFGQALQKRLAGPIEQDRLLGLLVGGPANTPDDMGRLGNARRQMDAGGARPQPQAAPQKPATPATPAAGPGPNAIIPNYLQGGARTKVEDFLWGSSPQ